MDKINIFRLWTDSSYTRRSLCEEKLHHHKTAMCVENLDIGQCPSDYMIICICQDIDTKTKASKWYIRIWCCQTSVFKSNIFHMTIRCLWINKTYIKPNFHRTTLKCDRAIVPTLNYLKCNFLRGFIFEGSIIIEHDFISDFIVMVYYCTIFTNVIFINLCLILWLININPTYVYQENYITPK